VSKFNILHFHPLAFSAGGRASTGRQRVLELKPSKLHEKCPIFLGSVEEIEKVEELYRQHPLRSKM
jgi:fructose-1,6-bisphosphatase I